MSEQRNEQIYSQQISLGNDWESCIYDLFNPQNAVIGEEFMEITIQKLNKYLNADFIFIAKVDKEEKVLESVAFCDRESVLKPFTIPYKNTPCEEVLAQSHITFKNNVQVNFPNDHRLQNLNVEGYSGVPLYNSSRQPIGVLTALFCDPIIDAKKIESLMFMFSSRISSELEHMEKERELKRRNLELLVFKEELIRKNKELDLINGELKQATSKAEESVKLKSSFLANLSHEIRTPMNAIIGFTELLKSNNLSNEEKASYLDIIHQNGNQLMRVMDALIDISKLQAKAYVETREKISINKILSEIYTNFSHEIKVRQKPIKLVLEFGEDDGHDELCIFKEAIFKIFDHLLGNAIKFTQEGQITLGYDVYEDYFEFFVQDTGIGIPKGEEERIFDLFRQVDIKHTREFGGNGIGLSIVKKYVEVMNGEVWAEPMQETGALIKFRLPTNSQE
ncbi:HAMP domain-containing histidine kinase [Labilibacter sediminis]|nr:HAMP domain-containing histidine kinase [Labilibacter sediminis]